MQRSRYFRYSIKFFSLSLSFFTYSLSLSHTHTHTHAHTHFILFLTTHTHTHLLPVLKQCEKKCCPEAFQFYSRNCLNAKLPIPRSLSISHISRCRQKKALKKDGYSVTFAPGTLQIARCEVIALEENSNFSVSDPILGKQRII